MNNTIIPPIKSLKLILLVLTTATITSSSYAVTTTPTAKNLVAISWAPIPNQVFKPKTVIALTATSADNKITYSTTTPNTISINGKTATILNAGTATIIANDTGTTNVSLPNSKTNSFSVSKSPQTITFGLLPVLTTASVNEPITVTTTSGLPISLSSSSTNATISGNTITGVAVGNVTITANQQGDQNYLPTTATKSVLVTKGLKQIITFAPLKAVSYSPNLSVPLVAKDSNNSIVFTTTTPNVVSISGSSATVRSAGTATIIASDNGSWKYFPTSVTNTLVVNKGSNVITMTLPTSLPCSPHPVTVTVNASSGLPVTLTSSTTNAVISGKTLLPKSVGTAAITASQAGDQNYLSATSVTKNVTMTQASQTITGFSLSNPKPQYAKNAVITINGTASSRLPVTFKCSGLDIFTRNAYLKSAGTFTVTASQAGDQNYKPAPQLTAQLIVGKGVQTINFSKLNPVRPDPRWSFSLVANSTSGLPISFSSANPKVATVGGYTCTPITNGVVNITATQSGDINYLPATPVIQPLTVTPSATPKPTPSPTPVFSPL